MRLLVWILGVICTLAALMDAYAIAPRWVWVFYGWLGLWLFVGLAVLVAALVRVAAPKLGGRAVGVPAPLPVPKREAQGGE